MNEWGFYPDGMWQELLDDLLNEKLKMPCVEFRPSKVPSSVEEWLRSEEGAKWLNLK